MRLCEALMAAYHKRIFHNRISHRILSASLQIPEASMTRYIASEQGARLYTLLFQVHDYIKTREWGVFYCQGKGTPAGFTPSSLPWQDEIMLLLCK